MALQTLRRDSNFVCHFIFIQSTMLHYLLVLKVLKMLSFNDCNDFDHPIKATYFENPTKNFHNYFKSTESDMM